MFIAFFCFFMRRDKLFGMPLQYIANITKNSVESYFRHYFLNYFTGFFIPSTILATCYAMNGADDGLPSP